MNWLKALACLLVAVAFGLFIAALLTPWYRVHHHDGTTTHMGLYNSYDEHDHTAHNDTHKRVEQQPIATDEVFLAESSSNPSRVSSPPLSRLFQRTSSNKPQQQVFVEDTLTFPEGESSNWDEVPDYEPSGRSRAPDPYQYQRRRTRALQYDDGWVTAIRVLLILTIVVSFVLLCWTLYHAFVHGTEYGWEDGPYMQGTNYLGYMLLFWAFINGIIILSLATSFGPPARSYDEAYAFNSVAFILLLLSMCVLCWPISYPVVVVSPAGAPYYGGREWGQPPPSTTFGGAPYGKPTYAATESTTPATATATATAQTSGTGPGATTTGPQTETKTGIEPTTQTQTQPFMQRVSPTAGAMPTI